MAVKLLIHKITCIIRVNILVLVSVFCFLTKEQQNTLILLVPTESHASEKNIKAGINTYDEVKLVHNLKYKENTRKL